MAALPLRASKRSHKPSAKVRANENELGDILDLSIPSKRKEPPSDLSGSARKTVVRKRGGGASNSTQLTSRGYKDPFSGTQPTPSGAGKTGLLVRIPSRNFALVSASNTAASAQENPRPSDASSHTQGTIDPVLETVAPTPAPSSCIPPVLADRLFALEKKVETLNGTASMHKKELERLERTVGDVNQSANEKIELFGGDLRKVIDNEVKLRGVVGEIEMGRTHKFFFSFLRTWALTSYFNSSGSRRQVVGLGSRGRTAGQVAYSRAPCRCVLRAVWGQCRRVTSREPALESPRTRFDAGR